MKKRIKPQLSITLETDLIELARAEGQELNTSVSVIIGRALRFYYQDHNHRAYAEKTSNQG